MVNFKEIESLAYPLCLEIPRQKKHVSLVIVKNRIISIGRNYFKTHPKAHKLGYLYNEMHSELDAFRKVPRHLRGKKLTLVNIRMNADGELRMSKPCEVCSGWCVEVFDKIYYTDNEGFKKL
jgi:hypothetical protein